MRFLLLFTLASVSSSSSSFPPPLPGSVSAVAALLDRLSPGLSARFSLSIAARCAGVAVGVRCYSISSLGGEGPVVISGTSAAELAAGAGWFLREKANYSIGWPRGGGSRAGLPASASWPAAAAIAARAAPFSLATQVCTHSYSLVWNDWPAWQRFLDWMALSGVNLFYALTGQEEIQYGVFSQLGVADADIRSWFNGPAFLTWSRGQNSHGSSIGGALPRSWMRAQWALQRQILAGARALGISPVLPAWQGVAPWPLATALADSNMTHMRAFYGPTDTAWVDALDPQNARIADAWMARLCADFGCDDGWFQMDGFFRNGTTWGGDEESPIQRAAAAAAAPVLPACQWSAAIPSAYLAGCAADACAPHVTLAAAQTVCAADATCGGITQESGAFQARAGAAPITHADETSWRLLNGGACRPPDAAWLARGSAAYAGIARTAGDGAFWLWQGWALNVMGGATAANAARLRGFAAAAPGRFVVADMSVTGSPPQWQLFESGDVPFIHTALFTFGGNDALKGNLSALDAALPWAAFDDSGALRAPGLLGTGWTPEGIDQNPVVYEMINEANFRTGPRGDVAAYLVARAHRRYGALQPVPAVAAAWSALAASYYDVDLGTSDDTGVALVHTSLDARFWTTTATPAPRLCGAWRAWGALLAAAPLVHAQAETFTYDLVNTAREVLAQLTTPRAVNFSAALRAPRLDAAVLTATGRAYAATLRDLDALLATDAAFLLGPWLRDARAWGADGAGDCERDGAAIACADFYEFNARAQLTTWYPAPNETALIARDGDYARKHWSGLVADYYATRVERVLELALADAAARRPLNASAVAAAEARLAFDWQRANSSYPLAPTGDAVAVASALRSAHAPAFAACGAIAEWS